MKIVILLVTLGYAVTIQGSLKVLVAHPGGIGGIFKGPNSETIVKGPDGSIITNEHEGGAVKTGLQPIVAAEEKVVVETIVQFKEPTLPVEAPVAAPLPVPAAPLVPVEAALTAAVIPVKSLPQAIIVEKQPHLIETELVDAPVAEPKESSDLVGPSGRISTKGSSSIVSGPASTTISEPRKVADKPLALITPLKPVIEIFQDIPLPPTPLALKPILPGIVGPSVRSSPYIQQLPYNAAQLPLRPITGVTVDSSLANIAPQLPSARLDAGISLSTPSSIKTSQLQQNIQFLPQGLSSTPSSLGAAFPTVSKESIEFSTLAPRGWKQAVNTESQFDGSNTWGYQQNIEYQAPENIQNSKIWSVSNSQQDHRVDNIASVQPSSTIGFTNKIFNEPSTAVPETIRPTTQSRSKVTYNRIPAYSKLELQQAVTNNGQLIIDPSSIPSRNIVPPEIGPLPPLPKGAIDLGTTVNVKTVSVPKAAGLAASTAPTDDQRLNQLEQQYFIPSEQSRLSADSVQISNVQNGNAQFTEPNEPDWRGLALRDPRLISQRGTVDLQLKQQGVDSTQINFEKIPLSSVIGAPQNYDVYDDTGLELANRYGKRRAGN